MYRVKQAVRWFLGNENYIKLRIELKKRDQRRRPIGITPIDRFLDTYSKSRAAINFVQIGANDGVFGDPIHTYIMRDKWMGVLVEPIPQVFDLLRFSYRKNTRLRFENCALGLEEGWADFYTTPRNKFWSHYGASQRSSLLPREGHEKITVKVLPFNVLAERNSLNQIQLIHTDTEGFDYEILKQIDFNLYQTEVILFEHIHLTDQLTSCYEYLKGFGFELMVGEQDTLAYRSL